MRFINTATLKFEDVDDSKLETTGYAILSHRWYGREEEISFEDVSQSREVSHKKGYTKFKGFCDLARAQNCRYAWMDTCCINKPDLTELSEAINSMYRWYGLSTICIAYLADVPPGAEMMESEWFDRGWTLQELISPRKVSFYNQRWHLIGTKVEFLSELSAKTKIPKDVLSHDMKPTACSIAQRMSWAAERVTTRPEDSAYSLLGLFDLNMTMIYGERERAFTRLQQQLMLQSKDESLFAWVMDSKWDSPIYCGLLAPSPSAFSRCGDYISTPGSSGFSEQNGYLTIHLKTFPYKMETYFALLECTSSTTSDDRIAILITRHPTTENEYARVRCPKQGSRFGIPTSKIDQYTSRQISIPINAVVPPLNVFYGFWLRTLQVPGHERYLPPTILSRHYFRESDYICLGDDQWGTAGVVYFQSKNPSESFGWSKVRWLKFGFDHEFNPFLLLANGGPYSHRKLVPTFQTLETAISRGWESREHNSIMSYGWIGAEAGVPSREYGWPSGIAIIKGNRQTGLTYRLEALNIYISIQLTPNIEPATFPEDFSESNDPVLRSREIWVVDITSTEGGSPENDHRRADCDICTSFVIGFFGVFTGCPCLYLSAGKEYRRRAAVRDETVVLSG